MMKSSLPYANATSGANARAEITKILRRLGCSEVGFMDDFVNHEVLLAFVHRGRQHQLRVSAKGWAQMSLRKNPWTHRHRTSKHDYEQRALTQGYLAINSIVRDLIKGQVTAIETGIASVEAIFMPWMLTSDGRPLIERLDESGLIPEPQEQKVVALPSYRS
jgi:hypothetical protein